MSYIRKIIGADEKLIILTRLHWIYLLEATGWLVGLIVIGQIVDFLLWYFAGHRVYNLDGTALDFKIDLYFVTFDHRNTPIPWMFGLTGVVIFIPLLLRYLSTEIGLTSRRVIYKKGLVMIEVQQVELEEIRGERIDHGWLGWVLGYGRLHFDCRFLDDVFLPATRDPYRLIKALHTARMRHESILYSIDDLDRDIVRIDQERIDAFKAREKLKRIGRKLRLDFNKSEKNA